MLNPKEGGQEGDINFKWGTKRGVSKNKDVQFYESFSYDDVKYSLYDCAFFCVEGCTETSIGKIVKIYETSNHEKKVKVVWFFRPCDLHLFLKENEPPHWKEVFLASGEGKGLSNIIFLESIVGKCNMVCTSNDNRNIKPSDSELRLADYFFCRTFDVGKLSLSEEFQNAIAGIQVEHFFNNMGKEVKSASKPDGKELKFRIKCSSQVVEKNVVYSVPVKDGTASCRMKQNEEGENVKRNTLEQDIHAITKAIKRKQLGEDPELEPQTSVNNDNTTRVCKDSLQPSPSDIRPLKKRNFIQDELELESSDKIAIQPEKGRIIRSDRKLDESGRKVYPVRRNWFKELPWEGRLQTAEETETLVKLENLDPSFTSSEVEELIWRALNEKVQAKMIQRRTFDSPHCGKAFVIFESRNAAASALAELRNKCLMLANGRVVIGRWGTICHPSSTPPTNFTGHLQIDKLAHRRKRQCEEIRTAVSTSHGSQPNSLEYDMAMEWCLLQSRSDLWWEAFHKRQAAEMQILKRKLKNNVITKQ